MWTSLPFSSPPYEIISRHMIPTSKRCLQMLPEQRVPTGGSGAAMQGPTASLGVKAEPARRVLELTPQSMVQPCLSWYFPIPTLAILPWNHDYKILLCRCLPGAFLSLHPEGLPAAWTELPLCCGALS